jgi:hypothetical protein
MCGCAIDEHRIMEVGGARHSRSYAHGVTTSLLACTRQVGGGGESASRLSAFTTWNGLATSANYTAQ